MAQHKDTAQLAQQIHHVLTFCNWAITNGSSTALLYSKRLVSLSHAPHFSHVVNKPDFTVISAQSVTSFVYSLIIYMIQP